VARVGAGLADRVAFAAGETSGDLLASLVLPALLRARPQLQCAGIAGDRMIAAGCEPWFHVRELSVRGYAEVLRHLPRLLKLRRDFIARVRRWPAQLFVGVDAPDFNLGVAARLRAHGIRTLQYVSPAVWAWRPQRIDTIRSAVDRMLCIFPFEAELFARAGIRATYVGHPLAATIPFAPDAKSARQRLGLATERPTVALLPGSRRAEVDALAPPFLAAAAALAQGDRQLQFVLPVAEPALRTELERLRAASGADADRVRLTDGRSHDCMEAADVVVVAGGTATLEAMLFKRPMVIAYRVPRLTEWITRRQAVIPYFGLPNVLEGRYTVPELLQEAVEPGRIAAAVLRYLDDPAEVGRLRERFERQHEALLRDTPALTAQAILDTLAETQR
jgi:lipid-A-disaccharide synthase